MLANLLPNIFEELMDGVDVSQRKRKASSCVVDFVRSVRQRTHFSLAREAGGAGASSMNIIRSVSKGEQIDGAHAVQPTNQPPPEREAPKAAADDGVDDMSQEELRAALRGQRTMVESLRTIVKHEQSANTDLKSTVKEQMKTIKNSDAVAKSAEELACYHEGMSEVFGKQSILLNDLLTSSTEAHQEAINDSQQLVREQHKKLERFKASAEDAQRKNEFLRCADGEKRHVIERLLKGMRGCECPGCVKAVQDTKLHVRLAEEAE